MDHFQKSQLALTGSWLHRTYEEKDKQFWKLFFSFIICPYRLCVSETFFCISHVYLFQPMCVFPFLSTYPYFFYPIFSFVISPMGTRVYLFAMWSMYLLFFCFTRFIHFLVECFHLKKFSSDQNYFIPG